MGLKLIWLLFTSSGSLWVSWTRMHRIGNENFWILDPTRAGSWIWKSLCKLRPLARPFVVCELGSGITASFWFDNWTSLGPLINMTGENGPRTTGLSEMAVVREAIVDNRWWLDSSRSRNPIIGFLKDNLPNPSEIVTSESDDMFLWRVGDNAPVNNFSSSLMWNHLYNQLPEVSWHKSVWFKGKIPKHAFITWLAAHDRLPTRDRMRRWGLDVSPSCLLCGTIDESRQHVFFDCAFSKEVWSFFCSKLHLSPPSIFLDGLRWIKDPTQDRNVNLILKLAFQASLYLIWRERNSRLHTQVFRPTAALVAEIQRTLRAKLDSLSRDQRNLPSTITFLSTWFLLFDS
ncbi:hypothetical protein N665_1435s0010 [Sinapis alba]|nr:hypothetical protein N665_1435s0010 [Sinapis alba]